jgi:hypothetical protein
MPIPRGDWVIYGWRGSPNGVLRFLVLVVSLQHGLVRSVTFGAQRWLSPLSHVRSQVCQVKIGSGMTVTVEYADCGLNTDANSLSFAQTLAL